MKNIKTYLVGGFVRDTLLGLEPKDKDYVVVGATKEDMESQGFQSVGADFPVYLHPETKDEYALARTERKSGNGYGGFDFSTEDVSLEDDLSRRDLTINSMALDDNNQVIDPFNGQHDLNEKTLRHTTDAFKEDPLRVLRIARFRARYGEDWTIAEETIAFMRDIYHAGELNYLTPERVWKETEKALMEPRADLYFETLREFNLFPELYDSFNTPQPPKHHPEGCVYTHTLLVLREACERNYDLPTRFAALTHDFGKPVAYQQNGNLINHEKMGVDIIEKFCDRLKISNELRSIGKLMSEHHTRMHRLFDMQPKKAQRLIVTDLQANKKPQRFQQFIDACLCDALGRGPTKKHLPYPQHQFALDLLDAVKKIDRQLVINQAMEKGLSGPDIGDAIRIAEIKAIRDFSHALKKDDAMTPG